MRKLLLAFLLIFVSACTTVVGPITGERYTKIWNWGLDPIVSAQYNREVWVSEHPEVPERFRMPIVEGRIMLGMSREMVLAAWGRPLDINRTITRHGVREQWVFSANYVYFENGVVTAMQD